MSQPYFHVWPSFLPTGYFVTEKIVKAVSDEKLDEHLLPVRIALLAYRTFVCSAAYALDSLYYVGETLGSILLLPTSIIALLGWALSPKNSATEKELDNFWRILPGPFSVAAAACKALFCFGMVFATPVGRLCSSTYPLSVYNACLPTLPTPQEAEPLGQKNLSLPKLVGFPPDILTKLGEAAALYGYIPELMKMSFFHTHCVLFFGDVGCGSSTLADAYIKDISAACINGALPRVFDCTYYRCSSTALSETLSSLGVELLKERVREPVLHLQHLDPEYLMGGNPNNILQTLQYLKNHKISLVITVEAPPIFGDLAILLVDQTIQVPPITPVGRVELCRSLLNPFSNGRLADDLDISALQEDMKDLTYDEVKWAVQEAIKDYLLKINSLPSYKITRADLSIQFLSIMNKRRLRELAELQRKNTALTALGKQQTVKEEQLKKTEEHVPLDELKTATPFEELKGLTDGVKKGFKSVFGYFKNPQLMKQLKIEEPPSILLYGPPGCGKTTLAKSVAAQLQRDHPKKQVSFHSIELNAIGSTLIHGTPQKLNKKKETILRKCKNGEIPVVLIDEIDMVVPSRDDDNIGWSDRKELMEAFFSFIRDVKAAGAVVIGTTNRKEAIDSALIRSGRFDSKIQLPLPTEEQLVAILNGYVQEIDSGLVDIPSMDELRAALKRLSVSDLKEAFTRAKMSLIDNPQAKITVTLLAECIQEVVGPQNTPVYLSYFS